MLVVHDRVPCPAELEDLLAYLGHPVERVPGLDEAALRLEAGPARAVFVTARALSYREALALQRCRRAAPAAALVVVAMETAPGGTSELKHAMENEATAFLRWPARSDVVERALASAPETR